jgi:DNA helicase HerA-like ATPase
VQPTSLLNSNVADRAVVVGRKGGGNAGSVGLLGKVVETSSASSLLDAGVWLDLAFPHVIGIFGSRGSGKSFDLGVIVEALAGLGPHIKTPHSSTLIFDVQDQFWTLRNLPDPSLPEDASHIATLATWGIESTIAPTVVLWAPVGYRTPLSNTRTLAISPVDLTPDDWLTLLEVERFSSQGQALLTLIREHPRETPEQLARRCIPSNLLAAFQGSSLEALRWRLESLSDSRLIGSEGLPIEEFLRPNQTSVVLIRQLPESLRALLVGVLTRLLAEKMSYHHQERRIARRQHSDALSQSTLPDRLWIFLDEAHVVVPAGTRTAATDPIIDYVKRGRDAGLSFVFATQQPSAVDTRLMSQVDITLTHYLGFDADLQAALARMPTLATVTYDVGASKALGLVNVLRLLEPGQCVVADSASGRVFVAKIRPRATAHGGNTPS